MGIQLTAEQQAFVGWPAGELLVVAVAGAGKTLATLHRVRHWIAQGISPQCILVATFSKRGAKDMLRRAAKMGIPSSVQFRTLNSCGWSIICSVADLPTSLPPEKRRDVVVVDPRSSNGWWVKKLLREYLKEQAEEHDAEDEDTILRMGGTVLSEISYASSQLVWPEAWTAQDSTVYPAYAEWASSREREPVEDDLTVEITDGFFKLWEAVKQCPEGHDYKAPKERMVARPLDGSRRAQRSPRPRVRWFSFDDQIAWPARWILEGKRFMEAFRGVFTHAIIDEAQDNNLAQTVLSKHLTKRIDGTRTLNFVGDDQQCIYEWRGSRPDLLRFFRDDEGAKQVEFTFNFRCAQRILDVGNAILSHATDRLYLGNLQVGRSDDRAPGGTVTGTQYETADEEAAAVIDGIQEAIENGVDPDDIVILYRLNAQSGPFELELIKRGVPYKIEGSSFFRRREVKAAVAWLTVATDQDNTQAFQRVCGTSIRGLGKAFQDAYPVYSQARSAYQHDKRGLRRGYRLALEEMVPHMDRLRELLAKENGLREALVYVFEDVGLRRHYRDEAAGEEDETDVDVAAAALIECAGSIGDVAALIRFATSDEGVSVDGDRTTTPRVTLSTIHKAKGLEWEYVAAPGWTSGLFPFFRAPLDEERRLGYVCATRAKNFLHISWTALNAKGEEAGASRLVEEGDILNIAKKCGPLAWPPRDEVQGGEDGEPDEGDDLGGFGQRMGGSD